MLDTTTKYLGLVLKNPVIISSSGLTNSVDKISKLEKYGAAAVVIKSLFEEQIQYESGALEANASYPEASDYILNYTKSNNVGEYLKLIEESKKEVAIPVIPSVNCIDANEWVSFAKNIENAGADALELNIYFLPSDKSKAAGDYEKAYLDVAAKVVSTLKIPVAVKLGNSFTNPAYMVNQLYNRGVKGVVLFNRFYEPDIDINSLIFKSAEVLSSPDDIYPTLRWTGIVSGLDIKIDIAASTGVHDSEGAIKLLLAGANAVMVCSALYKFGLQHVTDIVKGIETWMQNKNLNKVDNFRGALSYSGIPDPTLYERSQFIKYFSGIQ